MGNKTVANSTSVKDFIDGLINSEQREDSKKLLEIFQRVSGEKPVMWGAAIIGFGLVDLTYASGRQLEWLRIGFSPRKGKLSLYVTFDAAQLTEQFPGLGKYTIGKGCIYIQKLADVDLAQLEKLIETAWRVGYKREE